MAFRRGKEFVAVLGFSCFCVSQARVGFAQEPERCTLSGTVLNSATSAGIARALVSYHGAGSGFRFTDSGGSFEAKDVLCGRYWLSVSKPGFVSESDLSPQFDKLLYPSAQPSDTDSEEQSGRQVSVKQVKVDVKSGSEPARILLVPVSSIVGIVLDENGEPIAGALVQGIAVKTSLDGPDYVSVRPYHTDDRGSYALLSLPPGDYVVRMAGEASSTRYFSGNRLNPNNDHRGLQPVYYPNGDSPSTATVLHLGPGERATADFRQTTEPAFDIDGRLSGFVQQAWTQMRLYRDGDRLPLGAAFVNPSTGQFRVVDVPRGTYTLRVEQNQADPQKWLAAEMPLTVASQPLGNVVMELTEGADIPVSVSYEAEAQANGFLTVRLEPQHSRSNARQVFVNRVARRKGLATDPEAPSPPAEPQVLKNVIPDSYRLYVQTMGAGGDYVAAARLGERDVLHGEFPAGGSSMGELHLTIRGDSASVDGQVTLNGQPAQGAQVFLIPATGGAGGVKTAGCNPEGHYELSGVPPGEYRIQAWRGFATAAEVLSRSGETLRLESGEHRSMALEAAPGSDRQEWEEGSGL
jgi:hypothetical protein